MNRMKFVTVKLLTTILLAGFLFINANAQQELLLLTRNLANYNDNKSTLPESTQVGVSAACTTDPVVANNADSGAGSLRQAITDACDNSTITFANTVVSPITLASELAINKSLTIQGPGALSLTVSGNNQVRVFNIGNLISAIAVSISGISINNGLDNDAVARGAGIQNRADNGLTIEGCIFDNNHADPIVAGGGQGGAIVHIGNGALNINNSIFSNNSTSTTTMTGDSNGGAIANILDGPITITNSLFTGNSVNSIGSFATGGAIANISNGTLNITNTTISGNTVTSVNHVPEGGGIFKMFGTMNLKSCTIVNNKAIATTPNGSPTAGGVFVLATTANIQNTIVALNTADVFYADVRGTFVSGGYNLIGQSIGGDGFVNGVNGDQVGTRFIPVDPKIRPLASLGGSIPVHRLRRISPALDKGNSAGVTTDQRNAPRAVDIAAFTNATNGDGADIGAYESFGAPDTVMDFDGDGISDFAYVDFPNTFANMNKEEGDILANDAQRFWSDGYEKLLMLRGGRGFVKLPEDVQEAQARKESSFDKESTEAVGLTWNIRLSIAPATLTYNLGTNTDKFVPADYDGDSKCDAAVFTPASGQFTVINSSNGTTSTYNLGTQTSDPSVIGDYDGDGAADPAVYDKSTGLWSYLGGENHDTLRTQVWMPNGIPAPGDYNGDGKMDFAVQFPPVADASIAKFRIAFNDGSVGPGADLPVSFGSAVFAIIPGDYDGDRKTDIAQANLSGTEIIWRVLTSSSNYTAQVRTQFGVVGQDRTAQGDYDGDGKIDLVVYRAMTAPDDGVFHLLLSGGGQSSFDFGDANDYPIAFFNTH